MAKKNTSIALGITGMQRNTHSHLEDEKVYNFARNANLETDIESMGLTNEHSNILCHRFVEPISGKDQVVIGTKYDSLNQRIWFFLTDRDAVKRVDGAGNPVLDGDGMEIWDRQSEIGYLSIGTLPEDVEDASAECDCDMVSILNSPLEDQDQFPYCYTKYTTFIHDCLDSNYCLNFDPNYPIHDIVLKQEACGQTMTFASKNNPPRYILTDASRLSDYKQKNNPGCDTPDTLEQVCIDCEKLRIFPNYNQPVIEAQAIGYGGTLRRGQYEFYLAYADKLGNELTEYISATNPINIFDFNNIVLDQTRLADKTTSSISLQVRNLDRRFNFYKIVVIERTDTSQSTSAFVEGVHPITDSNITYSSNGEERISLNRIFASKPVYKNFGGLVSSNGYLFGYDYEVEKEWNLQPVANLLGTFLKWQTVSSKEDLYKDGVNNAKYRGYFRDEVYPFSIRFITNSGYKTALFPLIGRPAYTDEREVLPENYNKDVQSVHTNLSQACAVSDRNQRWQFYNTASILGYSPNTVVQDITKLVYKNQQEECIQPEVRVLTGGQITVNIQNDFINLKRWVQANYEDIMLNDPESDYYSPELYDLLKNDITSECDYEDIFLFPICSDEQECLAKYCDPDSPDFNEDKCRIVQENCHDGECYGICSDIEKDESESVLYIQDIQNESLVKYEKKYPWQNHPEDIKYQHNVSTKCDQLGKTLVPVTMPTSSTYEIIVGDNEFRPDRRTHDVTIQDYYARIEYNDNKSCYSALELDSNNTFFGSQYTASVKVHLYAEDKEFLGKKVRRTDRFFRITENGNKSTEISYEQHLQGPDINELFTDISAPVYPNFRDKISKAALWYKVDLDSTENKLFEITPISDSDMRDTSTLDGNVRLTIYDGCKTLNVLHSEIYDSKKGYWKLLKKSDFNKNTIYIVIDTPVVTRSIPHTLFLREDAAGRKDTNSFFTDYKVHMTSTLSGCFNVAIRPVEYYKVDVKFDKLWIGKRTPYSARCSYNSPSNGNCGVIPNQYGMFSFWESQEEYPSNLELYNSRDLKVDMSKLNHEDVELIDLFQTEYLDASGELSENANFACKKIRHFKFPDNTVAPFMTSNPNIDYAESDIYPLGITIDERTIEAFLDFAVESNLITSSQRKSITGYELFRGDRSVNKSVIMRGIANDMYEDTSMDIRGEKTYFRNFPYNTLGKNVFITEDKERSELIAHPYDSTGNTKFSLISPDIYYSRPTPGVEMTIDGYVYGKSSIQYAKVKDHSEWVILGQKAYNKATLMAAAEVAFETALNIATLTVDNSKNFWFMAGVASGTGAVGGAIGAAATLVFSALQTAKMAVYKLPQLKAQWLQIFEDRGSLNNFAQMYVSDKGYYNYFRPNREEGEILRGLKTAKYLSNGINTTFEEDGDSLISVRINNKDRESSMYLNTGSEFMVNYPQSYIGYDNYDMSPSGSSRKKSSDMSCLVKIGNGKIASPYVTLKNYVADQYGKIDEIKWVGLNHDPLFGQDNKKNIFGGDTYISRVDLKNKVSLFDATAVGLSNRSAFKYSEASNIAYTNYYVDYKSSQGFISGDEDSFINTDYRLDCLNSKSDMYLVDPAKFYTHVYGIPYFLVESEINSELRYSGVEPHEQFASRGLNVVDWVQEANTSIAYDNIFYYNNVYSRNQTGLPSRILPSYYEREKWDCLAESENGVAWSDPDNSEVSLSDPWLVFRPFNIYRFPFNFGRLIGLNNIESAQVVGRFSDNMTIFNAVDVIKDRVSPDSAELGTGGIFASGRPVQFSNTDLGETGSQHKAFISTDFGHFWVDAKRGKIFQLEPNGKGLTAISDFKVGGKGESGMRRWFKQHLPFKILKQNIPGLTDEDVDNQYKGIGISMGWDSRFKRVFITKRDYVVKSAYKGQIRFSGGNFYLQDGTKISLQDTQYFKDVSWTVAYSPLYQSFISYYDFKPDYYIALNDYFKTGINYQSLSNGDNQQIKDKTVGLWSHLVTNKSYQVFYGEYYPFEIDLVIKNSYTNKVLQDLKIWTYSHRYHTGFDYAQWRKKSFNKLIIYNQTNNSGLLHLHYDDSIKKSKYPISISQVEQGIPATHADDHVSINYFYNRVKNEENHIPLWINDENEIHRSLNKDAISFNSKRVLERIRGDWFHVKLIQDNTSQFKQVFKWMVSDENMY